MTSKRPLKVLIAKAGLDGHERGALVVAMGLRDAGLDVVYTGIRSTPEQIVASAVQEHVDAIGLSSLSGGHMEQFRRVMEVLKEERVKGVLVFAGGIIPDEDVQKLRALGIQKVFGPGSSIASILAFLEEAPAAVRNGGALATTTQAAVADGAEFSTLVDILRWRALQQPEQRSHTLLIDGESEGDHLTYAALDGQARSIGALLQRHRAGGERALLLYPAGLEFIAAFFGCLYARVIAVPVPPLNPAQPQRTLPRLRAIIRDAQPSVVLTTAAMLSSMEGLFAHAPELQQMRWVATDTVTGDLAQAWQDPVVTSDTVALLQYTSGSTAEPKGVVISHGNLLHNSSYINRVFALIPESVTVTWLPAFHDMGLTNGIIQPVYKGRPCYLMPPVSFLMQPVRWLQAIARYKATISGGPNFAYDLCARRITPAQRATLDLSSWDVAYNGAEPVRADTMKRFAAAFAACGFRPSAFHPCYGLAEATLLVAGGSLREDMFRTVQVAALEQHRVVEACAPHQNARTLVGSGHALQDTKIVIAHPELLTTCAPDDVGEVWVSSASVARGYWNRPEDTARACQAYLADTGEGPFLRTGDLGFIKAGELFVTGRLKDLIIISGRKLYPQDIELTAEQSHPALRPACCAAFSVDSTGEEQLVIAVEVEPRHQRALLDVEAVVRAIRRAVAEEHDVRVHTVALLRAGSIPRTTSGKVQRHACQASFLKGTLEQLSKE